MSRSTLIRAARRVAPWAAVTAWALAQARAHRDTRRQLEATRTDLHALRTWGQAQVRCYHLGHRTTDQPTDPDTTPTEPTLRRVV